MSLLERDSRWKRVARGTTQVEISRRGIRVASGFGAASKGEATGRGIVWSPPICLPIASPLAPQLACRLNRRPGSGNRGKRPLVSHLT